MSEKEAKTADGGASSEAHGHGEGHHGDSHYIKIWGILLALLVVSVLGPMAGIQILTLITAFGIAIVKAYLVVRNFMHLNVEPRFVGYMLASMLVFMGLFFFGTAPDVMHHEGQNWVNLAAQAETARAMAQHEGGEATPAAPASPEVSYNSICSACHGAGGAGDGAAAAALEPKPANFTEAEFWATRDRAHIVQAIRGGGAAVGKSPLMPSFGAQFDEEAAGALADHIIERFRPEGAGAEPAPAATGDGDGGAPEAADGGTAEGPGVEGEGPAEVEAEAAE